MNEALLLSAVRGLTFEGSRALTSGSGFWFRREERFRFQGRGFFLTDARLHRGASGAPVLMRRPEDGSELPWSLLGIHSSRFDMGTRDRLQDDSLGLNCAWYADILTTLTRSRTAANQEW